MITSYHPSGVDQGYILPTKISDISYELSLDLMQTNTFFSQFLKWSVLMFSVTDCLICEYTDPINKTKHWARRPDEQAGLVAELAGSFDRLSEQ